MVTTNDELYELSKEQLIATVRRQQSEIARLQAAFAESDVTAADLYARYHKALAELDALKERRCETCRWSEEWFSWMGGHSKLRCNLTLQWRQPTWSCGDWQPAESGETGVEVQDYSFDDVEESGRKVMRQ